MPKGFYKHKSYQLFQMGEKNPSWKGGVNKNKIYKNDYLARWKLSKLEKLAGRIKPKQCEVCEKEGMICFDHNHINGKFRGWLCNNCNAALGMVKDNPETLFKLIIYIIKNK